MAVVQISKIQVRRGKKNSTSGVPQLSSAEMAWTVDTQELFIGNGSVAEGAPYVGNTKILTEHDNILDLANAYKFANNDLSITRSISRSLQSKLDEYVSVKDYGAVGDGVTDSTTAFQNALDDLFRNTNEEYKKVLLVPNGVYVINSNLRIPSTAIIHGETQHGAVLNIGTNTIRLVSSDGSEFVDFSSTKRPESILISNIKILRTTGTLDLSGIRNSRFEKVTIHGDYELGDAVASLATESSAIFWQNPNTGKAVDNLEFVDCVFENNSLSIKCVQTFAFKSRVKFLDCKFFINHIGIYIDGVEGQSNDWHIKNCQFEETSQEAFRSTQGRDTLIESSSFFNCGNILGSAGYPSTPIVYFGEKINNRVIDSRSNRQQSAGITSSENVAAVIEVENADKAVFIDRVYSPISVRDDFSTLAVFSAFAKYITINYFLQLGSTTGGKHSRIGQLTISLGDDLAGINDITAVSITDSYQYSPNFISTPGGIIMTNFEFSAVLRDSDTDSGVETIALLYKNPRPAGVEGSISFDVTYGV